MSAELRTNYQGSASIYAIIRRISDAYAWNGSAFEIWSDGNIDNYDIALTDRSGDFYSADMPAAVAAGDYRAIYYVRAGAAPATTDLIVGTPKDFHWDGTAASSISSVVISPYALTTLDGLKRYLRITDSGNDTLLTETINQTSALIERVTGRNFLARDYRERYNGKYQRAITLKQYPVQHMTRVSYGDANAMHLSYSGSAIRANASIYGPDPLDATGGLRLVTISSTGTKTANNLSFGTYGSVSSLVTAVNAISGWSSATDVNVPSRDLNPLVVADAMQRQWLTYPDRDDFPYTLDSENGILQFSEQDEAWWYGRYRMRACERPFAWGFQGFLIEYNAGYSTVPDDVDLLCREICAEKFYLGSGNPLVKSESVGPYSVSYGSEVDLMIRQRLANYIDARSLVA